MNLCLKFLSFYTLSVYGMSSAKPGIPGPESFGQTIRCGFGGLGLGFACYWTRSRRCSFCLFVHHVLFALIITIEVAMLYINLITRVIINL